MRADLAIAVGLGAFAGLVLLFGRARVIATGYRDGVPFEVEIERTHGAWMTAEMSRAFALMAGAARLERIALAVNSAFRTHEEQARLYAMSPEMREQLGVGRSVAAPGYSNHQTGRAIDISVRSPLTRAWLERNAARFGFNQTVPGEPWHFELIT